MSHSSPRVRYDIRPLSLLATALIIGACASHRPKPEAPDSAPAAAPASTSAPSETAPTPGVSDANIAAIVVTANGIDVQAGELALSKSSNPKVKEFAQRMITDHTAVNKSATELVTKLGVTPAENATSTGLETSAEQTRSRLSGLSRAAFDKAYIDNEVAYHQSVLNAVDTVLIPSAQNAELKAMLVSVRPAFVAHLEHARQVQSSLPTGE